MTHPPPRVVLVFRCFVDEPTSHTSRWGGQVVAELQNRGFTVHDYQGRDASPSNFRDAVDRFNPYAIFLFDHGCECDVWGDDGGNLAPILGIHNTELTTGRVVVVLACSSAKVLGPFCVDVSQCVAYCGYTVRYGFYSLPGYIEGFRRCSLEVFMRLSAGDSLGRALEGAQNLRDHYMDLWRHHPPDVLAPLARAVMLRNGRNHVVLGDPTVALGASLAADSS